MARRKKETIEQAATPKKSQAPALIASLILLLISGAVLLYVLRLGGGQKGDTLDVLPTPERVRTDIDGFTKSDTEPPQSLKTLQDYDDYYVPDGTPIAPAEGDDNPFL